MPGGRSRRASPDRHLGLSYAPCSQHFSSRGSREVLFSGSGARRQTIWLALVDQPAMGQDLLRRMAAAGVVERCRTMALTRGMSWQRCPADVLNLNSFAIARHQFLRSQNRMITSFSEKVVRELTQ